jgi:hypothetical protein
MKTTLWACWMAFGISVFSADRACAQAVQLEQLALDIQKLAALKGVLKDLQKGYQVLSQGYETIKGIAQGNFNLHQAFLDGLLLVSPAVRKDVRVAEIIRRQASIISESQAALKQFRQGGRFSPDELAYMGTVYGQLIQQSLNNAQDLLNLLTDGALRMSDDERLRAIEGLSNRTGDQLFFLRSFNNNASVLSLQRSRENNDVNAIRSLYDIGH